MEPTAERVSAGINSGLRRLISIVRRQKALGIFEGEYNFGSGVLLRSRHPSDRLS